MADTETKVPVKTEEKPAERAALPAAWRPFESLRREVDRLFEDFDRGFWRFPSRSLFDIEPFWRRGVTAPAVDIVEREKDYQVAAELPGMEEKDVEVKVTDDVMTIKGEKRQRRKKRKRTTTCPNGTTAPSSAPSRYPMAWMPTRSRQASRKVY
jgi:HSP20 family protein